MTVNESFSTVLIHLRKSRKVSKAELGRRIGLSRQGVTMIEDHGVSVKLETVFKIAEALSIPVEDLVKLVSVTRFERVED